MSAKESRISGKSGLVKHKDSWKGNMDGRASEQATQSVHSHMYVLLEGCEYTQHMAQDLP